MTGDAVRTFLPAPTLFSTGSQIEIGCSNAAHNVKVDLLSSADGRWCIRAGIEGLNFVIQTVEYGDTITTVTNLADDEPASVGCSASHGLPPGNTSFRFTVRLLNNTIYLFLNGSDTESLRHALNADEIEKFGRNRHWGFESDVPSAKVMYAKLCTLESVYSERADWLAGSCGGGVYIVRDQTGPSLLQANVFPSTGPVSMVAYQGTVYGIGGGKAIKIDLDTMTISPWGDATGDGVLPGATETSPSSGVYIPGTTRMTILDSFLDRLAMAGDDLDPQNVWYCATGNPDDWNTAKINAPGRAFALSASLPGRIGEPVTGLIQSSKGVHIIGCAGSIWRLRGDPAIAIPDVSPLTEGIGISGKDAFCKLADGLVAAHSPEGALLIGEDGSPVNLSMDVLTEGIQIDREDIGGYVVQVRQDPKRHLVHFYLTPTSQPSDPIIHFSYCERTGRRRPDAGGWFPDTVPASMGPTASCLWRGRLILGTFDGYLVEPDDTLKTDIDEAIDCNIPMGPIRFDGGNLDAILHCLRVEGGVATATTSASSSVRLRVYAGLTAEMAFAGTERWKVFDLDSPLYNRPLRRKVRGPVLVVEASNDADAAKSIRIEGAWYDAVPGRQTTYAKRVAQSLAGPSLSPDGDLSFPTDPEPDGPEDGPGEGPDAPLPRWFWIPFPPVYGLGIGYQSPFEMANQDVSAERGLITQPSGVTGPGGGGGGDPIPPGEGEPTPPGGGVGGGIKIW